VGQELFHGALELVDGLLVQAEGEARVLGVGDDWLRAGVCAGGQGGQVFQTHLMAEVSQIIKVIINTPRNSI
jgi:hypothetical protein